MKARYIVRYVCVGILATLLLGCSGPAPQQQTLSGPINYAKVAELEAHESRWRHTPYAWGGLSARGIDCSGYVKLAFDDVFNVALPRTTAQQIELGRRVAFSQLVPGDLVFFDTSSSAFTRKTLHVGIYLGNSQFSHASVSKGVTVSNLNGSYWQKRFIEGRRL